MASVSGPEGDIKSIEMSSDMVYLCADSHPSESFEDPHKQALCGYSIESAKPNEDTSKPLKSWKDLVPKGWSEYTKPIDGTDPSEPRSEFGLSGGGGGCGWEGVLVEGLRCPRYLGRSWNTFYISEPASDRLWFADEHYNLRGLLRLLKEGPIHSKFRLKQPKPPDHFHMQFSDTCIHIGDKEIPNGWSNKPEDVE